MYTGKTVFSQIMDYLPMHEFRKCVDRYNGNYHTSSFSCLDQYLCMTFAQLTYRESLRDIEACLRSRKEKLYHLGIRGRVSRSTLAEANEKRDWRMYADFCQILISQARSLYADEDFSIELKETAYALDSTTIDLCLSLFPWASFRKHKAAVKMHTLLDLRGNIPSFIEITKGTLHDVNILDILVPEAGSFYIMDRGYLDFERLYVLTQLLAFFVTRTKKNNKFRRIYSHPVDRTDGLRCDQTIMLVTPKSLVGYHEKAARFSDQQFRPSRADHCQPLQMPMANRIVLQMDQATSSHQGILRHIHQCGKNPDLDRRFYLRPCCHYPKTPPTGDESLHNFADPEYYST
jgi:hypothetical protein